MTDPERVGSALHRVAFLGTPEVAAISLRRLIAEGIDVIDVVTAAPKRRGRGSGEQPTPVEMVANTAGIPVSYDPNILVGSRATVGIVVAYGSMLREPVLGSLPLLNLHFSSLPRWRGAAPVERAILAGDARVGVCVMEIEAGLDTGAVYARAEIDVGERTLAALWAELAGIGSELLLLVLRDGLGVPVPQSGDATHAPKLDKSERFVDPGLESGEMLARRVRLGGAWSEFRGDRLGIVSMRCRTAAIGSGSVASLTPGSWVDDVCFVALGDSMVELVEVQPPGKRVMDARDWARGVRLGAGDRLGHG